MRASRLRLSPEKRDRNEEQEQERYEELYAEIEEKQRAEYCRDFGPDYRIKYPFRGDGIHEAVMARMAKEKED